VHFGILSPDEIKAMSVCEIQSPLTYENGIPKEGGLMDLRMGTVDKTMRCASCNGDHRECPGHFGHIELAKPVYHIGFMRAIVKILKCVCFHCSSLLLSPEHKSYRAVMAIKRPARRLQALVRACGGMKRCNGGFDIDEANIDKKDGDDAARAKAAAAGRKSKGCGNPLPNYRVEAGFQLYINFPDAAAPQITGENDQKQELLPAKVHEIFKRISDEDCITLGLDPRVSRPDWMIITVLAVSPPPVRPSVSFGGIARSSDDITYKLSDIVKINSQLKRQDAQGAADHILKDYWALLQYHVVRDACCRLASASASLTLFALSCGYLSDFSAQCSTMRLRASSSHSSAAANR
jgi:DNA-directed RNA polymerase II subunit RPB1